MDTTPETQSLIDQQPYRGRVRTGCLTCRGRKVKCDEAKPHCANCKRLGRICVYKQPSRIPACPAKQRSDPSPASKTIQLDQALWSHRQEFQEPPHSSHVADEPSEIESPSALISRDIQLTTTMDYMAAHGSSRLSGKTRNAAPGPSRPPIAKLFLQQVDCPGITLFDPVNWAAFKRRVVKQTNTSTLLAEALSALVAVYQGQLLGVAVPDAIDIYTSSRQMLHEQLADMALAYEEIEASTLIWEQILTASFLICVAEMLYNGDAADLPSGPLLKDRGGVLGTRLKEWLGDSSRVQVATTVTVRVVAWLRIIHRITLRGGSTGLISDEIYDHLCRLQGEVEEYDVEQACQALPQKRNSPLPNINDRECSQASSAQDTLFQALGWPLFEFYYRLQLAAGYIARLTHYHRSRRSANDQDVVSNRIEQIRGLLHSLWPATRVGLPGAMSTSGLNVETLRSQVAPSVAARLMLVMLLCEAAWHAEIVELDRVLGDPVDRYSRDSRASVQAILHLVDASITLQGERSEDGPDPGKTMGGLGCFGPCNHVSAGFLRPLFMCAIETIDEPASSAQAIRLMALISNPIHKSDFFTAFARALSAEQQRKERRVTSKYFCLWHFGVAPPFM